MLFWGTRTTKQLLILGDFQIVPTIKVNVDQQLFGYPDSPKYLILCSAQERNEYRFGTTWEWVNNDRNVIVGWTIPLMTFGCMFNTVPLRAARVKYTGAHLFVSAVVNFHFRHNQLSLYVNLVCFDRIRAKDNFTNHALFDMVLVRVLLVYALRKRRRQTSVRIKRLTGKACMQIMYFWDCE